MPIVNPHPQLCPECGLSDRVVKATASNRVSPPDLQLGQPMAYDDPWEGFGYVAGAYIVGSAIIIAILSFFISSGIIGGFGCLVSLAIVFGLPTLLAVYNANVASKRKAEAASFNAALQIQNEAVRQRFEHDKNVYEKELYYCERDDVVFIRDRPTTCIPASQIEHLYGA